MLNEDKILVLVDVKSDPTIIPIKLSVGPKLGFARANGVDWRLSANQVNHTDTTVLLYVNIGNKTLPGTYPMELDANTIAIPNVNFTLGSPFSLVVSSCPPIDISQLSLNMPVKLPTRLPANYSLQGIDRTINGDQVIFYYSDKQLCVPNHGFNVDDTRLRIVITKVGTQENSTTYQNNWFKYSSYPEINLATLQRIQVNGYNGVGWEQHNAVTSTLSFLNDNDQTQYSLFSLDNQSLEQLLEIASSIPP